MAKERYKILLEKSVAAAISAIEIYNKPDFNYREETFSILIINAWEILLKAKILKDNNNKLTSILVQKKKDIKNGKQSKRFYHDLNRSKNPKTINIYEALDKIKISKILKENIELLIEIRDNAIHFINKEVLLDKKILEIGTANLKNYVKIINDWFNYDLSKYNFYLMPISFFHTFELESFSINKISKQINNLLNYVNKKETENPSSEDNDFNITLKLVTKFEKGSSLDALKVGYSEDADIIVKVEAEEQFANKYPLSNNELIDKLKKRYIDFKQNSKFNNIKKIISNDLIYSDERYLDYKKKTGIKKRYYSTEVFKIFDEYYSKFEN